MTSIAKFKISSNTAYNNDYLTLSETTDSNGAKSYAINVNKIYSYVHKFSIRAATAGVTADMEVTFTVCGTEKIILARTYDTGGATIDDIYTINGFLMDDFNKNANLRYYTITKAIYSEWFDLDPYTSTCYI